MVIFNSTAPPPVAASLIILPNGNVCSGMHNTLFRSILPSDIKCQMIKEFESETEGKMNWDRNCLRPRAR